MITGWKKFPEARSMEHCTRRGRGYLLCLPAVDASRSRGYFRSYPFSATFFVGQINFQLLPCFLFKFVQRHHSYKDI